MSREKKKNSKKRKLQENPDICIEDIIRYLKYIYDTK